MQAATDMSNLIHGGWLFHTWHRELTRRFESEVQRAAGDSTVTWPYWDWTDKSSYNAMMGMDFLGGDGDPANGYRLKNGNLVESKFPVSFSGGCTTGYTTLARAPGNGVKGCRDLDDTPYMLDSCFGNTCDLNSAGDVPMLKFSYTGPPTNEQKPCATIASWEANGQCHSYAQKLPTRAYEDECVRTWRPYSVAPHNFSVTPDRDWRACMEGMEPSDHYSSAIEGLAGASLRRHGQAHTWMGGSVATPTSPNDPIFFMIHANVDRLFTRYQQNFKCTDCLGSRPGDGEAGSDAAVYRATTLPYFQTNPTVEELLAPTNTYEDTTIATPPQMRKDVKSLTTTEKQTIVKALQRMKTITSAYDPQWNAYDYFVHTHNSVRRV
jgi:hypothetical protein